MDVRDPSLKSTLKVISVLMMAVGGLLVIAFFVDLASAVSQGPSFEDDAGMPNIALGFIGMPLLGFGGMLAKFAFLSEVSDYVVNETAPAARRLFRAVTAKDEPRQCRQCGTANDAASRFCDQCGTALPG